MKLVEFSITNYRSISGKVTLKLSDYTVLIGKNNQGKTNILKAIHLYFSLLRSRTYLIPFGHLAESMFSCGFSFERDYPRAATHKDKQVTLCASFSFNEDDIRAIKTKTGIKSDGRLVLKVDLREADGKKSEFVWAILHRRQKSAERYRNNIIQICDYINSAFSFAYVPAVRTEKDVENTVHSLIYGNIKEKTNSDEYLSLRDKLHQLEETAANEYNKELLETMCAYAPSLKGVHINISSQELQSNFDPIVTIDDGVNTELSHKGSGLSSLLVMALTNFGRRSSSLTIFEEPECHLHADAIHKLNMNLREASRFSPLIISTHNPSFVCSTNLDATYIVNKGIPRTPKSIDEVRRELGLIGADSLFFCEQVLLVEGPTDVRILTKAFSLFAPAIHQKLLERSLEIFASHGSSKIPFYAQVCNQWIRDCYVLLDHDEAGVDAYEEIKRTFGPKKVMMLPEIRAVKGPEIENCIPPRIVVKVLQDYGLPVGVSDVLSSKLRFALFLKDRANRAGKPLNDEDIDNIKAAIAKEFEGCTMADLDQNIQKYWQNVIETISLGFGLSNRDESDDDDSSPNDLFEQIAIFDLDDF
ncbi:MAG: AAA family ATPase [Bacilli bacterium]|nr:AAA family ATPase [Bacilli bacterium]